MGHLLPSQETLDPERTYSIGCSLPKAMARPRRKGKKIWGAKYCPGHSRKQNHRAFYQQQSEVFCTPGQVLKLVKYCNMCKQSNWF